MRVLSLLLATALMLPACVEDPTRTDAASSVDESADRIAASTAPETLSGNWRVVAIDGKPVTESKTLSLVADDSEIWWEPRCAGMVRGYVIEGNRLDIGAIARKEPFPSGAAVPAPMVCAFGLPSGLTDVTRVLADADHVEQTPGALGVSGVMISGESGSISLSPD